MRLVEFTRGVLSHPWTPPRTRLEARPRRGLQLGSLPYLDTPDRAADKMEAPLRCNSLACRQPLQSTAVVTTWCVSHEPHATHRLT